MEDKKLNEQESLALIMQMIQNSKRRISDGHGNLFLMWGYVSVAVSMITFVLIWIMPTPMWAWAWIAILILGCCRTYFVIKKEEASSMNYIDTVIRNVWLAVFACVAGISAILYIYEIYSLVLPVAEICVSLGMCVTGLILKDNYLESCSNMGMVATAVALCQTDGRVTPATPLIFAIIISAVLIAPGYHLDKGAKQINKEIKKD